MITLPDLLSKLNTYRLRLIDYGLSILEKRAGQLHTYAWQKRWGNREQGTGYRRRKHEK